MMEWSSLTAIIFLLVGCQTTGSDGGESANAEPQATEEVEESEHEHGNEDNAPEDVIITGLADHYHTGDTIELTAELEEDTEYDHWHWYIREDHDDEWEAVPDLGGTDYQGEATVDGQEIKAVLFDNDHEAYVQSEPIEVVIDDHGHDHSHAHDEESQKIYEGYFEDDQIEDRTLSDWQGDWQTVYPYLQSGDFDDVFTHKAEEGDMTAEEYKEYYEIGYETDVDRIVIENNTFTFFEEGQESSGDYTYDGYEILTYEKGNRGVRFIFKLEGEAEGMPGYIQFSDHSIFPTDSHHYHLYWGDDREALLDEVTNWPTYYPSDLDADEIAHEMIAH